jgi:NAD(P)-dependent dehydrogenase (short-subunit alcohol dehydrogenase family)
MIQLEKQESRMIERKPLAGSVAIVTGGGTGIGRATTLRLVRRNAHVMITGRRPEPLHDVAGTSDNIVSMPADIRDEDAVDRLIGATLGRWGRLDILINNAGVFAGAPLAEATVQHLSHLHDANVVAPTLLARAALPRLAETRGAIVHVSSTYGHRPTPPGASHYGASKAALEALTRSWAVELAPTGIRVNAVAPGPTDTPILAESGLPPDIIEAIKADEVRRIPLGRRGRPDDVARWIVALADPAAEWITGQVITVDGGLDLVA